MHLEAIHRLSHVLFVGNLFLLLGVRLGPAQVREDAMLDVSDTPDFLVRVFAIISPQLRDFGNILFSLFGCHLLARLAILD